MYSIQASDRFLRQARRFFRKHPDLKPLFANVVEALHQDPFQSNLHLHPLKGKLQSLHAVSLTHSYRITLMLKVTEKEIILLDIGSHDEVYR